MRKTRSSGATVHGGGVENDEDMANLRPACLMEKWMEKKVSEKVVVRRKSAVDLERKSWRDRGGHSQIPNSSLSSVDSSGGGLVRFFFRRKGHVPFSRERERKRGYFGYFT